MLSTCDGDKDLGPGGPAECGQEPDCLQVHGPPRDLVAHHAVPESRRDPETRPVKGVPPGGRAGQDA